MASAPLVLSPSAGSLTSWGLEPAKEEAAAPAAGSRLADSDAEAWAWLVRVWLCGFRRPTLSQALSTPWSK